MKKIFILFTVLALAVFASFISVSAQTELPAIDEEEAADLLGRWYIKDICSTESCVDVQELGLTLTYDVNTDNTIVVDADTDNPSYSLWFMEDGLAYSIVETDDNSVKVNDLYVDEDGMLIIANDTDYITLTRETETAAVSLEAVDDAEAENFAGEWFFDGIMVEGEMLPASLLGLELSLVIGDETITMIDEDGANEAEYIVDEGKLYAVFEATDSEGNALEEDILAEYHDDDSLFVYFYPDTEDEFVTIFTHEKKTAEAAVESAPATSEEEDGLDLSSLIQQVIGGEELDVNGLVQQFTGGTDISGLMQQFTGGENTDINSLVSGLFSGDQESLNIGGLLEGLTSGSSEGEGGFDLSGLLDMFGSGN